MSAVSSALRPHEQFDPHATAARARRAIGVRRTAAWVIRGVIAGAILSMLILAAFAIAAWMVVLAVEQARAPVVL